MADGVPLSEAALRRRRRRRRAAALAVAGALGGGTPAGLDLRSQDSLTGTYVPGESFRCGSLDGCWWTGGCSQPARGGCGGDGFQDVRQHVVVALRCLAGALEIQGYDGGHFANQQVWTEDTTMSAKGVFPGTVADERLVSYQAPWRPLFPR